LNGAHIRIEVAYAEPTRAIVKVYRLAPGSSVADALRLAGLDPDFDAVDLAHSSFGIFGRLTRGEHVLEDGDRIEIYRPLAADPKIARRTHAQQFRRKT
jgi:uncharacterized protein